MQHLPDLSRKDLFDAFKKQLAKDFSQSNFSSTFVEALTPDYHTIVESIANELKQSETKADSTVMQLLNRVDISEAQLTRYLSENKGENYFHVLAEIIVKRVLQKVVIKQYYKNKD